MASTTPLPAISATSHINPKNGKHVLRISRRIPPPTPKRLILHGPRPVPEPKRHVLRLPGRRLSDNPKIAQHSSAANAANDSIAPVAGKPTTPSRAAKKPSKQRLRAQRRELEAELKKQRRSTPDLPPESIPIRTQMLKPEVLETVMRRLYPRDWRERMAGPGVVRGIEKGE